MNFSTESPFEGPVPDSIPLPDTPLTGVLAQVKFPEVLSITQSDYIAGFQEKIRTDYPLNQKEMGLVLQFSADGPKQSSLPNWRFFDAAREWRLSLTTGFLALETKAYTNRQDFTQRIASVAQALSETINPGFITRIGVRYIDRFHGDQLSHLAKFVRPDVLGVNTREYQEKLARTFCEVGAKTDVGDLTSRWGFMPMRQSHAPDLMPAILTSSWFLDVDVFEEFTQPEAFDPEFVKIRVMEFATRGYGFFRWVVSDECLRACGGRI